MILVWPPSLCCFRLLTLTSSRGYIGSSHTTCQPHNDLTADAPALLLTQHSPLLHIAQRVEGPVWVDMKQVAEHGALAVVNEAVICQGCAGCGFCCGGMWGAQQVGARRRRGWNRCRGEVQFKTTGSQVSTPRTLSAHCCLV